MRASPVKAAKEPHPVYSDFVHLQSMEDLKFSVGLREENADEMLAKIAPLARYVPGKPIERKIKKVVQEQKPCIADLCLTRKQKLDEILADNASSYGTPLFFYPLTVCTKPYPSHTATIKALESKLSSLKNKVALTNKSIAITDDKNESLKSQIEELENRLPTIEEDLIRNEGQNKILESQLCDLLRELDRLKESKAENELHDDAHSTHTGGMSRATRGTIGSSATGDGKRVIFAKPGTSSKHSDFAKEVASVNFQYKNIVSDSDDDD